MNKIFKYELSIDDVTTIFIDPNATILSVGNQNGKLMLWAIVDASADTVAKSIIIVGTGNPMDIVGRFIGTVIIDPFVWHVFEAIYV